MKRLLLSLLMTFGVYGCSLDQHHHAAVFDNCPQFLVDNPSLLQMLFLSSCWASKFDLYNVKISYDSSDIISICVYNDECTACLKVFSKTKSCFVEYHAIDNTFNYDIFYKTLEVFLVNKNYVLLQSPNEK